MKITYKVINDLGVVFHPIPYENVAVLEVVSVMYIPSLGDPEDPDDQGEMEFTYKVKVSEE